MEELEKYDSINQANYVEYYPFVPLLGTPWLYFSYRYFELIEEYLDDHGILVTLLDEEEKKQCQVKLPEYNEYDFCRIEMTEILSKTVQPEEIKNLFVIADESINVDQLFKMICEAYHGHYWYPMIEDMTLKSILVDLNPDEVDQILSNEIPKDLYQKIKNGFTSLIQETGNPDVFIRLYSLSQKSNKPVQNEFQAIDLLFSSSRTRWALENYTEQGIMIRDFVKILPQNEYRLFIFGKMLRAISQYSCYEYFPELDDVKKRQEIYDAIVAWFPKVYQRIWYNDCVIDICFIDGSIKIIELNSFGVSLLAGSSLYNWINDYDIMHYSKEPAIRFVENPDVY